MRMSMIARFNINILEFEILWPRVLTIAAMLSKLSIRTETVKMMQITKRATVKEAAIVISSGGQHLETDLSEAECHQFIKTVCMVLFYMYVVRV